MDSILKDEMNLKNHWLEEDANVNPLCVYLIGQMLLSYYHCNTKTEPVQNRPPEYKRLPSKTMHNVKLIFPWSEGKLWQSA